MNWLLILGMAMATFGFVVAVACILTPRDARRMVLVLVLLGLVVSVVKVLIFQQTPQWHDTINSDSNTYYLNAKAFADHWGGRTVDGEAFRLRGLMDFNAAGLHSPDWYPDDSLTYALVIGSHEWLYTAYVALWFWLSDATQGIVIASNALWAAFFPAAAFGIAITLRASRRVALAAGMLALIDPSAGVNASWLLKDTLAGFLAMTALWALLAYARDRRNACLVIALLAFSALGGARFVAFLGLVISVGIVSAWLLAQKQYVKAYALAGALSCAWLFQGILAGFPHVAFSHGNHTLTVSNMMNAPVRVLSGGVGVLQALENESSADNAVIEWKNDFSENPVLAVVKIFARTLFSPYPWRAIEPGLNWQTFLELYYPGTILWIACLPGVLMAVLLGMRRKDPVFWLIILFFASQFAAYAIWHGGWSVRQRVFVHPAFFALAAIGWIQLAEQVKRWKYTLSDAPWHQ